MRLHLLPPLLALSAAAAGCGGRSAPGEPRPAQPDPVQPTPGASVPPNLVQPAPPQPALVLYDPTPTRWSETHALAVGHLLSHFGRWRVKSIADYAAGDLDRHSAVAYVGVDPSAALPAPFLDDVLSGHRPVLWLGANLPDLAARQGGFADRFGFVQGAPEQSGPVAVEYKGARLFRDPRDGTAVRGATVVDPAKAQVLATGVRADGSRFPWAVRAGHLTFVGEVPFSWARDGDRSLVVADLLFDLLAPATPERHRGLVRVEDVSPIVPPDNLRAIADTLASLGAPFSVAVIPVYADPLGTYLHDGKPLRIAMRDAPQFVAALQYMIDRGGTLVMHGYTHQYSNVPNPYDGSSGPDFEFWRARMSSGAVQLSGPVPGDCDAWATGRVQLGLDEFAAAGLPAPEIFEFPHYAASADDARAVRRLIPNAYHRGLYFPGTVSGGEDLGSPASQSFPYDVSDVYGFRLLPENCGFYSPTPDGSSSWGVPDLVANARTNRVVRDGFASFFFHPWFDPSLLRDAVSGMQAAGYTFVRPGDVLEGSTAGERVQ